MQVPTENTHHQPLYVFTLNVINTITHLLLGAVAFGAICFANLIQYNNSLKSHIYLCVIGYVILMAQAILSLNPYNGWSNVLSYEDKKISHWVMQVVGSIFAISGSIIRLTDWGDVAPFLTAHGILGFSAMIMTIVSLIGGVINIYSSRIPISVSCIRMCHSCLGSFVLIAAFVTLCLGYNDLYRAVMGNDNANMMIALTVLALIGTVVPIYMRIFSRICK